LAMRYGGPVGDKHLKLSNLITEGASMKSMAFINRAKIVEFADIARSAKPIERTTLKHVRASDNCYCSGHFLQRSFYQSNRS